MYSIRANIRIYPIMYSIRAHIRIYPIMYIIRANIRIYPIMHIIRPNIHVPKQSKGSKICKETSPLTRRWTRLTSRMQIYRSFYNFPSFFHSSLMSRWFRPTGRYTFMCYLSLYRWTLILCCLKNTRSAKSASVKTLQMSV